ncbi:hypothetical protein QTP86_019455 [Hemibagrus guttatus]|nr:hypothetical protein QTP86_019455 [Hemibagrus guttatus]
MAARWSSENVVVEFRDAQATAMSVDCLGHYAVLSGRRFLHMVNLEAPSEAPRKIGRQSKWDVGTVQWNPHKSEAHLFAASSNQRVDLYVWRDGCGESHTSLQGHTRVISDLDWSWFEPELLVTSSVDTYIYIWDTRDTRKPTGALSAVAGASQVKWNRKNQHCLASSHDGDVRIWDRRKPNTAVEYVAAHLSKIHGLDWHPDNEYILATSSQDNSVRFWDYRQPRKYLNILSCQVPVWKARYTPFSNGLVTVMVPQLRRENSLLLWSTLDLNSPVHAFVGHDDVVLEFQWRPQKEGSKDFQLVTWSRDQTLRIWRVDPQLQKLCASDIVEELMEGMTLTTESEKTLRSQEPPLSPSLTSDDLQGQFEASSGRQDPTGLVQTLQQEFSLVNLQIRNINVEMDAVNRTCFVSAHCGVNQVRLVVKFPAQYPNNAAPSFQFVPPTTISSSMKTKIQKILTDTSLQKVKRNQNCLEPCVRQLVSCLESDTEDGTNPHVFSNSVSPALPAFPRVTNTYGSYQDANIPFPRTSGARFCGTDLEKAYDRVPREELWYCMRKSGVAEKYVRVVQDMYERSRTVVRCAVVMDQLSEEVRQESPWTMMFADDIVICSESREQVEENLERWRFALERRGMKVSGSKTEYMCVNEREGSGTVRLQGEEVKKVQEFKYLGSTVQSNGECGKEVKKRVQAGWNGWRKVSGVLCDQKISARIKGKVYRTVVRPAMLYGLETVSLRKRQESELEVAELKMLRFSLGVTRLDRIRNEYIRGTAHVGRLGDKVREARLRWFGHVQRRESSLVYFTRPMSMHRTVPPTEPTPRSLSALSAYHSGLMTPMKMRSESQSTLRLYSGSPTRTDKEQVSISSFYYKERKSRRWKGKREGTDYSNKTLKLAGKVIIQDISCLLPIHKALGEAYVLNMNDIRDTCQKNAAAALTVGRRDLAKVLESDWFGLWRLQRPVWTCTLTPDPDTDTPWARHPFGRQLLETLLEHYSQMSDVQTLAMLCSVFRGQGFPQDYFTLYGPRSSGFTLHHSRYPSFTSSSVTSGSCSSTSDSISAPWNMAARDGEQGLPWGESSPDEVRYANQAYTDPREREKEQHDMNKRLLDPANTLQYDDFKKCYGEILHRWGLKEKRAEVLKFVSCPPEPHKGIEFGVYCCHCRSQARGTQCAVCKRFTFQCAICHVAVRGSSNFCLSCGHGGHTSHMMEWFRSQEVCPTGCGCHCLLQSTF